MNGRAIEVFGEGSARDYTYIDDIADGLKAALNSPEDVGVYNLGCGRPVEMNRLLDGLQSYFPDLQIVRKPERVGDVKMTWADTSKAEALLGYRPKVSIEEGLARSIAWARSRPEHV